MAYYKRVAAVVLVGLAAGATLLRGTGVPSAAGLAQAPGVADKPAALGYKISAEQRYLRGGALSRNATVWTKALLNSFVALGKRDQQCGPGVENVGYGGPGDGEWFLCHTKALASSVCVIFSFGIGFDDTFDNAAAKALPNCGE